MTREEAKHIVDVAFDVPLAIRRAGEDRTYQANEIRKAKDMAINALSQEQQSEWERDHEILKAYADGQESMKPCWIPVSERLPELNKPLWVTAYHRVCYAHMISESGNYGYPVFRLHELKDSDRGWVQETISHEPYSKGRIDAWMYIDIPQPYKVESEGSDADSD